MKKLSALFCAILLATTFASAGGWWARNFVTVTSNASLYNYAIVTQNAWTCDNKWTSNTAFASYNFGAVSSLVLNGGYGEAGTSAGTLDFLDAASFVLYYRAYSTTGTPGAYSSIPLTNLFYGTSTPGTGTGNVIYNNVAAGVDVKSLVGNAPGTYYLEVIMRKRQYWTTTASTFTDANGSGSAFTLSDASTGYKATFTISSSSVPVVTPTVGTYTYNGLPQGPNSATNTGTGSSYTFSYAGTGYGPTDVKPTTAGSYTVTATVAADGSYSSASSAPTAFTIGSGSGWWNRNFVSVTSNATPYNYGIVPLAYTSDGNWAANTAFDSYDFGDVSSLILNGGYGEAGATGLNYMDVSSFKLYYRAYSTTGSGGAYDSIPLTNLFYGTSTPGIGTGNAIYNNVTAGVNVNSLVGNHAGTYYLEVIMRYRQYWTDATHPFTTANNGGSAFVLSNASAGYKATFTISITTGVKEPADSKVKITSKSGIINASFDGENRVELLTLNGQLISSVKATNQFTQSVKNGAYLLRINGKTHKVMVH